MQERSRLSAPKFIEHTNHLEKISRSDLAAIRQLKNPPESVQKTIEAIWRMLNKTTRKAPPWESRDARNGIRALLAQADFITRLFSFDPAGLPHEVCCTRDRTVTGFRS